jgi:hypothetical protein
MEARDGDDEEHGLLKGEDFDGLKVASSRRSLWRLGAWAAAATAIGGFLVLSLQVAVISRSRTAHRYERPPSVPAFATHLVGFSEDNTSKTVAASTDGVEIIQGPPLGDEVFAAYVDSSDAYLPGLEALAASLIDVGSTRALAVILTDAPSKALQSAARCLNLTLVRMSRVANPFSADHYDGQENPFSSPVRFKKVFSKLNIWRLPVKRVVFLDADMVVLKNIDELFTPGEPVFRASPDKLWDGNAKSVLISSTGIFNSGLLVIEPSMATFKDMLQKLPSITANEKYGKFADGSDQGFLNKYYEKEWVGDAILDTKYNTMWWYAMVHYQCQMDKISVLHNVGEPKPWMKEKKQSVLTTIEHPFTWIEKNLHEGMCGNSDEAWETAFKSFTRRCG